MERNYFVEKFDQIKWTCEDQSSSSGQAKSYACTFCNRGFLNAQALGGHMNIHRRDRARDRIKQQYYTEDKNQLSSDGVKNSTTAADPPGKSLSQLERKQGTNMIPRKPSYHSIIKSEGHETVVRSKGESGCSEDVQPQLQLPLFVEAPELASESLEGDRNGCGGVEKLDLELRLGIEPPETNLRL